ncbi:Fimbrillin-A associated anchor proteins Mfa1 and Mfa2 [Porphyromonas macacae]|uniref:Fimbrillin-A associated anchor proteins Mfa1 and Mfa2 n=2 Tax=Porphyromonas macacae TaxID=28115 RepID=A0A379DL09_9PORP|nr:Fimbrillin-A associated anchor proteins Mfa1 and Mfa2 [Porphyromonas macacae]
MNYNFFGKLLKSLFAFFLIVSLFASCSREQGKEPVPEEPAVFMTFQIGEGGMRAQHDLPGDPSVNQDNEDFEDHVERLAALVFDAAGNKIAEYFGHETQFRLKLKPGKLNFFFLANYSSAFKAELKSKTKQSDVEAFMQTLRVYTMYKSGAGVRFPMARIYLNQDIPKGGTMMDPIPFIPSLPSPKQLSPVSLFGSDHPAKNKTINLVRACAKVSMTLKGEGVKDVKTVKYHNAATQFSFMQLPDNYSVPTDKTLDVDLSDSGTAAKSGKVYIPELLFNSGNKPSWDGTNDQPKNGANYIEITTKSGRTYKIPVINNGDGKPDYMKFAKSKDADHRIIRNQHYKYDITLAADTKEIIVKVEVMPWTLVQSQMDYTPPFFDKISIRYHYKEGEYAYMNNEKTTVFLFGQPTAILRIRFREPKGGLWNASITNGLDFELIAPSQGDSEVKEGEKGATGGIVDANTVYVAYLRPRKPFTGMPRFTEILITVNGKEIQVCPGYINQAPGPGKRMQFKQIE